MEASADVREAHGGNSAKPLRLCHRARLRPLPCGGAPPVGLGSFSRLRPLPPLEVGRCGLVRGAVIPCAFAFHFTRTVHSALVHQVGGFSFRFVSDGTQRRLSDYAGRVVVLTFWATWCQPCMKELHDLEHLAQRGDVVVLSVSDEPVEDLRAALPAGTARVNGYFADVAPTDAIGQMAYQGRPTTLVLDRSGAVRKLLVGAHTLAAFETALHDVLSAADGRAEELLKPWATPERPRGGPAPLRRRPRARESQASRSSSRAARAAPWQRAPYRLRPVRRRARGGPR